MENGSEDAASSVRRGGCCQNDSMLDAVVADERNVGQSGVVAKRG